MNEWWPAPAKLNLFLHITGRRPDGYHELQTAFQFLDHGDKLKFNLSEDSKIELLDDLHDVSAEDNLIVRAAKLLQFTTQSKFGATIQLEKHLPMGGGLGGGSSDAATTLVALNKLWRCNLTEDQLATLGLQLGADVPVFVRGHAAWAEGVGEIFTRIDPAEPWYLVIFPECAVSTAEIFSATQLTRDCDPITIAGFLAGEGSNICEPVVKKLYPPVAQALAWLAQYAAIPRMTGTGSCVFARFDSASEAEKVLENVPEHWHAFTAKGCNESPLSLFAKDFERSLNVTAK